MLRTILRTPITYILLSLLIGACSSDDNNPSGTTSDSKSTTVARAGADQTVAGNDSVYLNGYLSTPADTLSISQFIWSQDSTDEIQVSLDNPSYANIQFLAPIVHQTSQLHFRLTVTDSAGNEASDEMILTVNPALPFAYAGPDINVYAGTQVTLNGSDSREFDELDSLKYYWTQIGNESVTLSDRFAATPNFQAPLVQVPSNLSFRLEVTNNKGSTVADEITLTVLPLDSTANLPIDYLIPVSTQFSFSKSIKLDIIDNANPDKLITIENFGVEQAQIESQYNYNPNDNSVFRYGGQIVVYVKGGKIWLLDLTKNRTQLVNQLSPESDVICDGFYIPEAAVNLRGMGIFYRTPGLDNDCSTPADNRLKLIYGWSTPASSSNDLTDLVLPTHPQEIRAASYGYYAVTNFASANKLRFYQANFSTFSDILDVANPSSVHFYEIPSLRYFYVSVDNKLYVIEKETAIVSTAVWDVSLGGEISDMDCGPTTTTTPGNCFFSVMRSNGLFAVYTFPGDGSEAASDLLGSELSQEPKNLQATNHFLFFIQTSTRQGIYNLFRIPANPAPGEPPSLMDEYLVSDSNGFFTNGGALFYNLSFFGSNAQSTTFNVVVTDEYFRNKVVYTSSKLAGYPSTRNGRVFESMDASAQVYIVHNNANTLTNAYSATISAFNATSGKSGPLIPEFVPSSTIVYSFEFIHNPSYGNDRYYATARFYDPTKFNSTDQTDIILMDGPTIDPVFLNLSNSTGASETLRF